MTKLIATSALLASLAVLPVLARAQDASYDDAAATAETTPDGAAPTWTPPAPPAEPPAAPQAEPQQAPAPPGQWVYTEQYGWIWMPYSDVYTQVPANGWGEPYAYVYYPAYSTWTWVAAPWVWGYGPWPVFGAWGPARFGWYAHGWWRYPTRWHYAPANAWYPGGGWRAPVPHRGGAVWGGPRVAPYRSVAPVRGGFGVVAPSRGGFGGVAPSRGGFGGVRGGGPAIGGHAAHGGGGGGGRGGGGGHRR